MESDMAMFLPTLTLLLIVAGTTKVYGRVCYVGQEQDRATKRYGWSLAEQRPCECTEFRLGGVNTRPQIKPFEVNIGEDIHVDKHGKIVVQFPDCSTTQSGTKYGETSPCAQNTCQFLGTLDLQLPMTSPLRLEFTVIEVDNVQVYFSPNGPGKDGALYLVYLGTTHAQIFKRETSSQDWIRAAYKYGVYIGVPVTITHDNDRVEVAVKGVPNSAVTYDVTSPPQPSWFVSFDTDAVAEVKLSFTEPCIDDFNPQITPQ